MGKTILSECRKFRYVLTNQRDERISELNQELEKELSEIGEG